MRQNIKRIFLTLLICFGAMLSLSRPVLAATGEEEQAAIQRIAEQNLQAIVQFDDATLERYIAQFETEHNTALLEGLRSWQHLKELAGDFVAMDHAEVRALKDSYVAQLSFHCEKRDATMTGRFNRADGSILQMSFDKVETLSEKMKDAGFNLLIGMGTVFLVLIFIAFIISRFKLINDMVKAGEERKKEAEHARLQAEAQPMPAVAHNVSERISPEQVRAAVIPEGTSVEALVLPGEQIGLSDETLAVLAAAAVEAEGFDSQLIAVLTAAVMAAQGEDAGPDGLVVRSIRRISRRDRRQGL